MDLVILHSGDLLILQLTVCIYHLVIWLFFTPVAFQFHDWLCIYSDSKNRSNVWL